MEIHISKEQATDFAVACYTQIVREIKDFYPPGNKIEKSNSAVENIPVHTIGGKQNESSDLCPIQ